MNQLEDARKKLSLRLTELQRIWDDFLAHCDLTLANDRLHAWAKETEKELSLLGKKEKFHDVLRLADGTVDDPVDKLFEEQKRLKVFLENTLKETTSHPLTKVG